MVKLKRILGLMALLLLIYSLLRLVFYFVNFGNLAEGISGWKAFYWGLRMDFAILFYVNLPFFLFFIFIADSLKPKTAAVTSFILILLLNVPLLAINIIDIGYFRFTGRRSTIDLFYVTGDSLEAVPGFLKKYWYLFLLFMGLVFVLYTGARKICRNVFSPSK